MTIHTYFDYTNFSDSVQVTSDFPSPLELKKWNHSSTVRKAFVAFLKKITQTKPCIEMMQLLLFLERDLFQDNFMMAHFILFFGFFNIVHSTSYMFSLNAFLLSFVLWLRLFALLTAQRWRMRLVCIRRVLFHYFCTFFCYLIFCCLTFLAPFIYPHPRNLPTTHNI